MSDRFALVGFLVCALAIPGAWPGTLVDPPGEVRDQLTAVMLMGPAEDLKRPVHNAYFVPLGTRGLARHELSGTLAIPQTLMTHTSSQTSHLWFPAVELDFFTHDGHLIPVQRDIVRGSGKKSLWDIIVSPGRVWSEAGDGGLSRASFPFVLSGRTWNESRNGIATFVYDDQRVSSLQFQIVQEAAYWNRFLAWGRLRASFNPHDVDDRQALVALFEAELAHRLPRRPLSDLEAQHGASTFAAFSNWGAADHISVSGLVVDGVIYSAPCGTQLGEYPYCAEMRHGVYSVTKTAGAMLSVLRLAQKYGDEIFELKVKDYVDVTAVHDGWKNVTFADALNMATGVGDKSHDRRSKDNDEDDVPIFWRFAEAPTTQQKLRVAFSGSNYPWGPGEVYRYRSMDTFILATALDSYLKRREGPGANLWDMIVREVLTPIGIQHAPLMHTREYDESRGTPLLAWGFYPTVDDLAKIARMLQNGGKHEGEQLLSAAKLEEALYRWPAHGKPTQWIHGGAEFSYYLSFWHLPLKLDECRVNVPHLIGYGGNIVQLLPNGMTSFYLEDGKGWQAMRGIAEAAHRIQPFCGVGPS